MPRVFISYSHDSAEHQARVALLAQRLRADGIDLVLDADMLPGGPTEGWPQWSERQVKEADFVLVACTPVYSERYEGNQPHGVGLGAVCEARAIRQLLHQLGGINQRIRVLLFEAAHEQEIPLQLRPYHFFQPQWEPGYADLLAWLKAPVAALPMPQSPLTESSAVLPGLKWPSASSDYKSDLADRKDEFAAFEKMITNQSSKRILLLHGSSNSGKTVLMTALRGYALHLRVPVATVDFKGCPSLDRIYELFLTDLGPEVLRDSFAANRSGDERFLNLVSDLKRLTRTLVLLFDTYQEAGKSQEWLEGLLLPRLDQIPGVIVVVGGQSVPEHDKHTWRELVHFCEVGPIDRPEDWLEYSARRWQSPHINAAEIKLLTRATGGNPGLLRAMIENTVRSYQIEDGE